MAALLPGRSNSQCMHRHTKVEDPIINKQLWTKEEESMLLEGVATYGEHKWTVISRAVFFGVKTGKQCREKWSNDLRLRKECPDSPKKDWTAAEDSFVLLLGNKNWYDDVCNGIVPWQTISDSVVFKGKRTANQLKNRFHVLTNRGHSVL